MTLKDLGLPTLEQLEAMSDEQIIQYFSKYLSPVVCNEEEEVKPKKSRKKKLKPEQLKLLNDLLQIANEKTKR